MSDEQDLGNKGFAGDGRKQNQSLENLDTSVFPFEAFETT